MGATHHAITRDENENGSSREIRAGLKIHQHVTYVCPLPACPSEKERVGWNGYCTCRADKAKMPHANIGVGGGVPEESAKNATCNTAKRKIRVGLSGSCRNNAVCESVWAVCGWLKKSLAI